MLTSACPGVKFVQANLRMKVQAIKVENNVWGVQVGLQHFKLPEGRLQM